MNYPKVFDKFQTVFTGDGLATLDTAYNCKIKEVLNGEFTLSFVLPRTDPNWQYIKEENFINIDGQNFRIKGFEEQRDEAGKLLSNVQCEHVYYDSVNCKHIPLAEMIGYTPLQVLQAAFLDTRFTIDTVEVTEATDIFDSKTNPAKIVSTLIDNVGGELVRNDWNISLVNKRGSNSGVQFRFGKNIKSLKKNTGTKNLVTRLYPYGKDGLDISSVYVTSYIDSPYISYYDRPHINYKDYNDVEDSSVLLAKGQAEFSTTDKDGIDKPTVTYQIDVVELKKFVEFGAVEAFSLGDVVTIIDEELNISTTQRIVSYEYYPYESLKSSVELSNNLSTVKSNFGSLMAGLSETKQTVERVTTNKGEINAGWLENIKSKLSTEINAGLVKALMHEHGDIWVDNPLAPTKAMAIIAGMYAVANSKKENGDWDWRTIGTADKFVADEVDVNWLKANVVVSNTVITQNLYAAHGTIAELTVDQLDTSDKVVNYLAGNTADVHYIKAYDQHVKFIEAQYADDYEQLTDRNNAPIYWIDDTHTGTTLEVTEFPVYVYKYTEFVKMEGTFQFDESTGYNTPKWIFGSGIGNTDHPDWGKGYVFKDTDGLVFRYITSTGVVQEIKNGEDGIEQIGNTGKVGLRNIAVDATAPTSPKNNDLWIDTDA